MNNTDNAELIVSGGARRARLSVLTAPTGAASSPKVVANVELLLVLVDKA